MTGPTFALFADGYPAAQGVYCAEHIGPMIAYDASHVGSTNAWKVRPSGHPCRVCDNGRSGAAN